MASTGPIENRRADGSGASRDEMRRATAEARLPSSVLVREDSGAVVFPAICANCAASGTQIFRLERALEVSVEDGDGWRTEHEIIWFPVPFCAACLQRHYGESKPPSFWLWVRRLIGTSGEALGGAIVLGVGLFFLKEAVFKLSLVLLAFACFPLCVGGFLLRKNWRENAYLTVPKDTEILQAVEFTPVLSETHEPAWRAFQFRNGWYAEQFRLLNAARLWDPRGTEAQAARAKRRVQSRRTMWVVGTIVAIVLLWSFWDDYGREFAGVLKRWLRM